MSNTIISRSDIPFFRKMHMRVVLPVRERWKALTSRMARAGRAAAGLWASRQAKPEGAPGSGGGKLTGLAAVGNPMKSVGGKLFIIFFASILFFVLTVGLASYNISKSIIQDKVGDASEQTIVQAGEKMDLMYAVYEDLSLQILLDESLMTLLRESAAATKGTYDFLQISQKIVEKLNVYSYSNKTIRAIHVMSPSGEVIASSGGTSGTANVKDKPWFGKMLEENGRVVWLESSASGYTEDSSRGTAVFGLGRALKNGLSNEVQGALLMEINLDSIAQELERVQMGDGGETMIVTPELKTIYSQHAEAIGQDSDLGIAKEQLSSEAGRLLNDRQDKQLVYYQSAKNGWYLVGAMKVEELVKDARLIYIMTWVFAIVAAVLAVVIGFFVARMIGRPLGQLRTLMKQGEEGDLRVRMSVTRQDEIGQLGLSFNEMMEKITALVQQTNHSAQEVLLTAAELSDASKQTKTAAQEIAAATEQIAGGATSLAVEAERGNELTGHISVQMKEVVRSNVEMGTAAAEVQKSSEQGIDYMSGLISKTNATETMTRSMVEKVDKLKESTRSIRKILDMLNNITKQTNILSLNATIEAARAGAAGKGFMVVADEIRKLADQSRQSIEVVGSITETIQREIDETVEVLSEAYPIFQEQIDSVKETDLIFKQVQSQMSGFIGRLSEVTESISQLESSQVVLTDAMSNVSAVAEESSATSQEVASLSSEQLNISSGLVRLSEKLEELSTSLKETLSKFQV